MSRGAVMPAPSRAAPRPRLSGRLGPMALASLAVLLVGWSALWLFARHQARSGFDTWIEDERAQGRIWTCPGLQIGGFPFGIVLSCTQPTFKGALADSVYDGTAAGLTGDARLYFPTNVVITVAGPLTLQDVRGGPPLSATWSRAQVSLRGDMPGDLDRGLLSAQDLTIALPGADAATPVRVGQIDITFRPLPPKPAGLFDAEATLVASDLRVPQADAAFKSPDPIAVNLTATVTRFGGTGPTLPELLEPWREAGGQLRLKSFTFRKGEFRAAGDGRIELDEDRRLEGRLQTRFWGFEPVAKAFGIPTGAVKLGGALSALLGGSSAAPNDDSGADLALPLVGKQGRLWIGPVKTGVTLDPLY